MGSEIDKMQTIIPTDYHKIFCDNTILITGVGRSGTTILGKIIGSMNTALYLFEPAIMKYLDDVEPEIFRGILFEDYFLPIVQGRGNMSYEDDSWVGHYLDTEKMHSWYLCGEFKSRADAKKLTIENETKYVIKTNEAHHAIPFYREMFPGLTVVKIKRDKEATVKSMMKKGWYTDSHMKSIVDYVNIAYDCPYYIFEEHSEKWAHMTHKERCCSVYESLERAATQTDIDIEYEKLLAEPKRTAEFLAERLNLAITDKTISHIESVKNHQNAKNA